MSSSSSSSSSITSSTSSSGTTRILGLYSTIDVDSLVKASVTADKEKIAEVEKDKTYAEWKKEAYQTINTLVSEFQETYLSSTSTSSSISLASVLKAKTVTQTSSTAMTITATSSASASSFTVNSCKVATNAKISSSQVTSSSSTSLTSMTISELANELGATLSTSTNSDGDEVISMTVNGTEFEFATDTTVSSMMKTINNAGLGVKMAYNELTKKFEIKSTSTGSSQTVTVSGNDGLFFGSSGIFKDSLTETTDSEGNTVYEGTATGTDATIVIDGVTHTNSSNSFTIGGFKFNLLSDTDTSVGVTAQTDVDTVYSKIKAFVDAYNTMITSLKTAITEKRDYDYEPLTDDQKEDMTESEISKWEAKAKAGILYGDSKIRSLLSDMSTAITNTQTDSGMTLAKFGITTGNYFSDDSGLLVIDEDKLKDAIENNVDDLAELFTKTSTSSVSSTKYSESGIAYKLNSLTKNYVKVSTNITIANLTENISDYEDKISDMEDKLADKEDKLYDKYAQLEATLAQMDAMSSSLFSS
ncbi:MAG: flagellar filament capping protein FliD [Clostridia bacterium]|nr:flagellar filament capping protein FliD [Clostridia bacterium]